MVLNYDMESFEMVKRDVYSQIYRKINKLVGGIENFMAGKGYLKLKSSGFMDLVIEKITDNEISIAHYCKQNGDMVPDPDLTARIDIQNQTAEALSYQDGLRYELVYPAENKVNLRLKKQLNTFINGWLTVLQKQGFYK